MPLETTFYPRHREKLVGAMHLFALSSIAIAQPLFDVLGNNTTYFVANRLGSQQILIFAGVVWLCIPLLVISVELGISLVSKKAAAVFRIIAVGAFFLLIFLPVAKKLTFLNAALQCAFAFIPAVAGAYLYARMSAVKMFVSALAPAILVVPVLFIFFSPIFKILFPPSMLSMKGRGIKANIPVVIVVFDEFSLVSLMESNHTIDSVRYPNFYSLAKTSTWYRNATTVCDVTERVVPAILTGQIPNLTPGIAPSRGNYPENLLTLLHEAYDVRVMESVTDLSMHPEIESMIPTTNLSKDFKTLQSDINAIFLSIVLPNGVMGSAPILSKSWGGFAFQQFDTSKKVFAMDELWQLPNQFRREKFRIFIDSLRPREKPPLYFIHTLLPHVPYEYLPSGKQYLANPYDSPEYNLQDEHWSGVSQQDILQSMQRYLLQVGFVDRLIGELVARMKSQHMFDESMLIVTADHGVSFWENDYRRPITHKNFMDILPVPLFIKMPGQKSGIVSDANVELTDILPTIASTLKIEIPWSVDGMSVSDSRIAERTIKRAVNLHRQDVEHTVNEYRPQIPEKDSTLHYLLSNFGSGTTNGDLYKIGKYRQLIGFPISQASVKWSRNFLPEIDQGRYYESLSLADDPLPTEVAGQVQFFASVPESSLAIIVNDTIRGVTEIDDTLIGSYSCVIPDYSLHAGKNKIDVALAGHWSGNKPIIYRSLLAGEYSLKTTKWGEEFLENPLGEEISIQPLDRGSLDTVFVTSKSLVGAGWAADVERVDLPNMYLVFVDGRFHFAGIVGDLTRTDLAQMYRSEALKNAGFTFEFKSERVRSSKTPRIRVFAVFDTYAAELVNRTWTKPPPKLTGRDMFQLVTASDARQVIAFIDRSGNQPIPVDTTILGVIDLFKMENGNLVVGGWAADVDRGVPAGHIIMMVNDTSVTILPVGTSRPDLVKGYHKNGVEKAGFYVTLPISSLGKNLSTDVVRFFAISKDEQSASELSVPARKSWKP